MTTLLVSFLCIRIACIDMPTHTAFTDASFLSFLFLFVFLFLCVFFVFMHYAMHGLADVVHYTQTPMGIHCVHNLVELYILCGVCVTVLYSVSRDTLKVRNVQKAMTHDSLHMIHM